MSNLKNNSKPTWRYPNVLQCITDLPSMTVADPGFPRGGGANPPGEIERIWTGGGVT